MTTAHDHRVARLADALADRYTIERELGRGGAATVYLAYDRKHDRHVALKVLKAELSATLGTERFLSEIRLLARLQHPYILPLYDSGGEAGMLYYVMPYVEGESLRTRLDRERQLPMDDTLRITRQVAEALAYAHAHNVVHRDIKPENILLAGTHAVIADFGIARAISRAGDERSTAAGVTLGTPAYMSPEQASGDAVIDGRSDIYSLACVLYEMLGGRPPFTGPTPQAVVAKRFTDPPPRVRAVRPTASARLERAVSRALALLPADRFNTAADFAAALPPGNVDSMRRLWWRRLLGGLLLLALAGAAAVYAARDRLFPPRPALDQSLMVVLPFGHAGGGAPRLIDGNQCEQLLYDAFSRWTDLRLVNSLQASDAQLRRGVNGPLTLAQALDVARGLGAGTLAWGEVREFNGRLYVRAALYDARNGARLREHQVEVDPSLADASAKFNALADALVVGQGEPSTAVSGAMGTKSVEAWRAYARGHVALGRWDLPAAAVAFRAAAAADPGYAHAYLWLAEVESWARSSAAEAAGEPAPGQADAVRDAAARALENHDRLPARESALAEALVAMQDGRYPAACDHFARLVAADSSDFAAWYGLGECHGRDPVVLRDARSPSGWRFRGSYQRALNAYEQALRRTPSAHLAYAGSSFGRLGELHFLRPNQMRLGYSPASRDTLWFAALPSLEGDTLAFVPRPLDDVVAAKPSANPPTTGAAVARNRSALRQIAVTWVSTFPNSPDAREQLARVLEAGGELTATTPGALSARDALRDAWRLSPDPARRLRLAAAEARLRVKLGDFAAARRLADSLLANGPGSRPADARLLAGAAALTGRGNRTAELLRRTAAAFRPVTPTGGWVSASPPVIEAALALLGYAAMGGPADSVGSLYQQLTRLSLSYVEPGRRDAVRQALLARPASLAFPTLGRRATTWVRPDGDYLLEMQAALARGDTASVRAGFDRLRVARAGKRPSDVTLDVTHQEAWLLIATGDTAAAAELLDLSLGALPAHGDDLLEDPAQAAGLVRAMMLRAHIAERQGDPRTARRWASAAVALWGGADPPLRPAVDSVRAIASGP